MRRGAMLLCLIAGCGSNDPCADFSGDSCISLDVHGIGSVDQIVVAASGFTFSGRTPNPAGAPHALPVQLAVLPGAHFSGSFALAVSGLFLGGDHGDALVRGVLAPGQHLRLVAELVSGFAPQPDLATANQCNAQNCDIQSDDCNLFFCDNDSCTTTFRNVGLPCTDSFSGTQGTCQNGICTF